MNKWHSGSLARNRAIVRSLVLLMAICSLDTMQLVLCHADGQQPRMEQALLGQCLDASRQACGTTGCAGQMPDLSAATSGTYLDQGGHRHCTDCSDQLIHARHLSPHAVPLITSPHGTMGGCLYSVQAGTGNRNDQFAAPCIQLARDDGPHCQNLLLLLSTQLLI